MKIWQKKNEVTLLEEVDQFTIGDDYLVDRNLIKQDIAGSIAHARMLLHIGILSVVEQQAIEKTLQEIYRDYQNQKWTIEKTDEDVHSKVEKILIEKLGDTGKKLHTARSRNDQVLTDLRLYNKEKLLEIKEQILKTGEVILSFAQKYEFIPMCGYTHMQRAMPSSVGQWASAFAEEFLDSLKVWQGVFELNDASPLGSGAGFGVSLSIDRQMTASLLGFERVQVNPIYCQNSRGKTESLILSYLTHIGLICNKIASDLMLFTTTEFGFFEVSDKITTGSSIMPQKRNLDVMELVRGKTAKLLGNEMTMKSLVMNLISGYHRDLQDSKKIMVESFELTRDFLKMIEIVFSSIVPNEKRLIEALDKTVFATDYAYEKVKQGMPFRDAYREVGLHLEDLPEVDARENIRTKTHIGSTGNLGINHLIAKLKEEEKQLQLKKQKYKETMKELLGGE